MKQDKIDTQTETQTLAGPQASDYLDGLQGDDLTDEQKLELVEVLFQIMKSFVQLGYGMEPVNKLIAEFESCASETQNLLEKSHKRKGNQDE